MSPFSSAITWTEDKVLQGSSWVEQPYTGACGKARQGRRHGPSITYKITPCWVTLLQPAKRVSVLGHPSSLRSLGHLGVLAKIIGDWVFLQRWKPLPYSLLYLQSGGRGGGIFLFGQLLQKQYQLLFHALYCFLLYDSQIYKDSILFIFISSTFIWKYLSVEFSFIQPAQGPISMQLNHRYTS